MEKFYEWKTFASLTRNEKADIIYRALVLFETIHFRTSSFSSKVATYRLTAENVDEVVKGNYYIKAPKRLGFSEVFCSGDHDPLYIIYPENEDGSVPLGEYVLKGDEDKVIYVEEKLNLPKY